MAQSNQRSAYRSEAALATAGEGKILRHGISIAIVGRPNVGKVQPPERALAKSARLCADSGNDSRHNRRTASINEYVQITDTAGLRKPRGRLSNSASRAATKRSSHAMLCSTLLTASAGFAIGAAVVQKPGHSRHQQCDLPIKLKSMPPEAIRISACERRHPRTAERITTAIGMTPNAKSKVDFLLMNPSRCVASGYNSLAEATRRLRAMLQSS